MASYYYVEKKSRTRAPGTGGGNTSERPRCGIQRGFVGAAVSFGSRFSSSFAKSHAWLTCSVVNALTTVRCRYQLFASRAGVQISLINRQAIHFVSPLQAKRVPLVRVALFLLQGTIRSRTFSTFCCSDHVEMGCARFHLWSLPALFVMRLSHLLGYHTSENTPGNNRIHHSSIQLCYRLYPYVRHFHNSLCLYCQHNLTSYLKSKYGRLRLYLLFLHTIPV